MLIPKVVGFRMTGELAEGATATDLVLTVTEMLREHGVVGKFVEFYGPGIATVPLANRATIGNMSPEYGSTAAIFPIDEQTLRYLEFTGRSPEQIGLVEAYAREQGLFWTADSPEPRFSDTLELDLSTVEPSLAGPKRPQDRVPLSVAKRSFRASLAERVPAGVAPSDRKSGVPPHTHTGEGEADIASELSFPAALRRRQRRRRARQQPDAGEGGGRHLVRGGPR
jgi:aconitate hydratase